ncbi:MAG: UDP-N-acetylmuramoyl-L-alanine--D-glutamate ligase [Kiritimatiellae bacterium]|nr:UDP-N-acetylmuramoyl-L-alanine--D-glutamate ligase [Kiritimatiellia bacterium]
MEKAVVLGAGVSGMAAADLLRRRGWSATVLDKDDAFEPDGEALVVASPGVPLDHPWQAAARAAGIKVVSELQLGAWNWKGKILAVTGSKGKSSVVKLVQDGLVAAGRRAVACGNYGTPLCRVVLDAEDAVRDGKEPPIWAVVEVSSFQMETSDDFHPDAAACLNLQEDHLDRHGSVEVYHALKRKLLSGAKCVVDADDAFDALLAGSYFDNRILRRNGELAAALMRFAGLDDGEIARAFRDFKPLPHRMQLVAEIDGVRYVDDSKATSLDALAAGVEMAGGRVRLIAGGLPKGDDPKKIIYCLQNRVEKVYLIGTGQNRFCEAWRDVVECELCDTLERAVASAKRDAARGETVLLSPGAASFDQFRNYGARGDAFAMYAKEKTK